MAKLDQRQIGKILRYTNVGISIFYGIFIFVKMIDWMATDLPFFGFWFYDFFFYLFSMAISGVLVLAEFKPEIIRKQCGFILSLLGRGVWNIYLGSVFMHGVRLNIQYFKDGLGIMCVIFGFIYWVVGIVFIVFHFLCSKSLNMEVLNVSKIADSSIQQNQTHTQSNLAPKDMSISIHK